MLKPLGLTITEPAKDLGVSRKYLLEFLNGKISLCPDLAIRISKVTNSTPESWLGMQTKLDIWHSVNIEIYVKPFLAV